MLKHYLAAMLAVVTASAVISPAQTQERPVIDAERAVAVHECSVMASRYPVTTWGSTEFEVYRACMARRGQVE